MKKTSYHHNDLRNACIERGLEVISTAGLEALSLRSIAKDLDVSHGAPYKHFETKNHLIAAIMERCFTLFGEYLADAFRTADAAGDSHDSDDYLVRTIGSMGRAYIRFAFEHPEMFSLMFTAPAEGWDEVICEFPAVHDTATRSFGFLVSKIEEMQNNGIIRNGDVTAMATFVWSTIHGFATLHYGGNFSELREHYAIPGDEALTESLLAMIIAALRPSGA